MRAFIVAFALLLAAGASLAGEVRVNGKPVEVYEPGALPPRSARETRLIRAAPLGYERRSAQGSRRAGALAQSNGTTINNNIIIIQPGAQVGTAGELTPTVAPTLTREERERRDPRLKPGCRQIMGQVMVGCGEDSTPPETPTRGGWRARANRANNP